ncbi:MerR family DNA-binding transcriptional regulator [Paenibacillus sp. HJGM_3]|uniref:MerR family DNA-binding transcriptional regulator n=1 Tax=Paenibacillus sp. HJGM_3 TaxID=3379816 RepID=UPI00385F842B
MRPKKMATTFMISASTLRNYEAKGLIPPAERSAKGHRMYTDLHAAYLGCIQGMAPAFGMETTTEALHDLQHDKPHDALWAIRKKEVALYEERVKLERLIEDIRQQSNENKSPNTKERFAINEVSKMTKVPKSTIRYWEQAGYVTADRDDENRYRYYSKGHLLKIRLIHVLQSSVYSEDTVKLKQSIAAAEHTDLQSIMKLAEQIQSYQNKSIESQMCGISYLWKLIQLSKAPI